MLAGCGGSSSGSSAQSGVSPACLPSTLDHSAKLEGVRVDVSPAPETDTANPHTQISFLGVPAARIHVVSVVGEHSGSHAGHLEAYSQGDGASFVPDTPFDAGERVLVHAVIGVPRRRQAQVAFSFRVDTPYPTANVAEFPNPQRGAGRLRELCDAARCPSSDPDRHRGRSGPGGGRHPHDQRPRSRSVRASDLHAAGSPCLVRQAARGGETAEDLNVQTYEGQPALTWWQGRVLSLGFGQGEDLVMNSRYQTVARVHGGNGLRADLHDFQIAPGDVAYITAFNPIRCDLASVKGARDGTIIDTAIQEIDMKTGLVRWEWHSLDHVAAEESEAEAPSTATPWDWFHLNSIDPEPDGNILISARSTWAGYQLEAGSGKILWRLGGLKSSFKMGPGTETAWQHDGRILAGRRGHVLRRRLQPAGPRASLARVRIKLDLKTHEARLAAAYTHPNPPLLAASQGNMQTLADGNTVVGYGGVPEISEYAADGSLLFDAHLPFEMAFYRGFRYPWSGRPASPPATLASLNNTGEETIVHVSWNGATEVASWRVLAGKRPGSLAVQTTMPASGFESSTTLPKKHAYVAVQALDSAGHMLASSRTVKVISYAASLPSSGSSG